MGTATSALERVRKARRLTQEQLAVRAGLTAKTIRSLEQGTQPRFKTQIALAEALECDPDELWPGGVVE